MRYTLSFDATDDATARRHAQKFIDAISTSAASGLNLSRDPDAKGDGYDQSALRARVKARAGKGQAKTVAAVK